METKIKGIRYNYKVFNSEIEKNCYSFSIKAICKTTKKTSSINNINTVLSELGVNPENKRFENSIWDEVTEKESKIFSKRVNGFLKDTHFLTYLENCLDEDRECGKWKNHE